MWIIYGIYLLRFCANSEYFLVKYSAVVSNYNIIAKSCGQCVPSPRPSSVRYRDMRHDDILRRNIIDILGHGPLVSFRFPYHWTKLVHSNCAICYPTLFFTYIVDAQSMSEPTIVFVYLVFISFLRHQFDATQQKH